MSFSSLSLSLSLILFFFSFSGLECELRGIIFPSFCYKCMYPNGSSATIFRFILCSTAAIEDSGANKED